MIGALHRALAEELRRPVAAEVARAAAAIRQHFGDGVGAILFYGGGLRRPEAGTLLDFYVLAEDLRAVLPSWKARVAARLLPPNVYAIDAGGQACKVAVISMSDFAHGMRAFAPHLWARFAQPATLAYARDDATTGFVVACLDDAVTTAITRTLPLMPVRFTAEVLWSRLLAESYAAELRPESRQDRARDLVAAATMHYRAVTAAVLGPPDADGTYGQQATRAASTSWYWALCRPWGKLLNAARLMKGAFTYAGGLDYAVAKIARHSGVTVAVTEADRRRPLLGGIRIFLEARRKGGVR